MQQSAGEPGVPITPTMNHLFVLGMLRALPSALLIYTINWYQPQLSPDLQNGKGGSLGPAEHLSWSTILFHSLSPYFVSRLGNHYKQ